MVLRWHPFQLRPGLPAEGVPLSAIIPPEYLAEAETRIGQATRQAGLPFNRHPLVPNTHLAHEASAFARDHGQDDAFHRAVLRAYFANATWIGGVEELVAIGVGLGLDEADLREALETGRYRESVDVEMAWSHHEGITAVPAFVFGEAGMLSGAQPYEVFQRAMAMLEVPARS